MNTDKPVPQKETFADKLAKGETVVPTPAITEQSLQARGVFYSTVIMPSCSGGN